jgi:hypothetical protein
MNFVRFPTIYQHTAPSRKRYYLGRISDIAFTFHPSPYANQKFDEIIKVIKFRSMDYDEVL